MALPSVRLSERRLSLRICMPPVLEGATCLLHSRPESTFTALPTCALNWGQHDKERTDPIAGER